MQAWLQEYHVLVAPGLHGSGQQHWQSRWETLHPRFQRVEQTEWDVPDLDLWCANLDAALRRASSPVLVVAHSFGCLATVFRSSQGAHPIAGALLVAPADPDKFGLGERLRGVRLDYPSLVVGSENDPWMESPRAERWATHWGSAFVSAGALGHINAESGLGDWPQGWALFESLCRRIRGCA